MPSRIIQLTTKDAWCSAGIQKRVMEPVTSDALPESGILILRSITMLRAAKRSCTCNLNARAFSRRHQLALTGGDASISPSRVAATAAQARLP